MEQVLKLLSGPIPGPKVQQLPCTQCQSEWKRDADSTEIPKFQCPVDWYEKDFHYDLAYYLCRARYGDTALTCSEMNQGKVSLRAQKPELMKQITEFTQKKFEIYKRDLAQQCCGSKKKCLERFSGTQLRLTSGMDIRASYISDGFPQGTNIVEISMGKLASAMNQESVERVILVELAHACQFALVSESPSDYDTFTSDKCSIKSGSMKYMEGLGTEMASCLNHHLQKQIEAIPEKKRHKYCFGKWYREAFSDMKFRSEFTSIYHWTYDFLRRSHSTDHGNVLNYIKCGVTPELKAQVCK
jgi:hypothetical protein